MRSGLSSGHPTTSTTRDHEKRVCSCGTLVLFYGDLQTRTCWKCQAQVARSSSSTAAPFPDMNSQSKEVLHGGVPMPPPLGTQANLNHRALPGSKRVPAPWSAERSQEQRQVCASPPGRAVVPRQTCSCGTLVLFPGELQTRTCWNCQAVVIRRPKLLEAQAVQQSVRAHIVTERCAPVLQATEISRSKANSPPPPQQQQQPPQKQQQPFYRLRRPSSNISIPATPEHQQLAFGGQLMCCGCCMMSALLNLVLAALFLPHLSELVNKTKAIDSGLSQAHFRDSDGDGIPDHNDHCVNGLRNGTWISGIANDFDGDGCQDGVEDLDQDNDGVKDSDDNCPRTPQWYQFVSDSDNDFDRDGCKDGIEDSDDDGDQVVNKNDDCPRTRSGAVADDRGCSQVQREEEQAWEVVVRNNPDEAWRWHARKNGLPMEALEQKTPRPPKSDWEQRQEEWFGTLQSAWIEVLLGAILSSVLGYVTSYVTPLMGSLQRKAANAAKTLPGTPTTSMKRISNAALLVVDKQGFSIRGFLALAACTVFYFAFICTAYLVYVRRRSAGAQR